MTAEELDALYRHATRFRCESVQNPLSLAPDEPDAHEAVHKHITILMDKIITAKWFLKDLEAVALEWLAGQFTGRAADQWTRVVAAARVTATTSGMGHNSVLYRCLRDMVLAYPATGIKANLQLRKLRDLSWNRKDTVAQTTSKVQAFYEAYDRAVELTRTLGVTLQVPAQDYATRFTEMQVHFPEWANQLVVNHPERFTSPQACWTALVEEAARKAAGKAMGEGGGLAQLGLCTVGDLDNDNYTSPAGLPAPAGVFYDDEGYLFHDCGGGGLFALRPPGCWRCGSHQHLRKDCSHPASAAELAGAPVNQWAKLPPPPSSSTSHAAGVARGVPRPRMALPPPPTSSAQVADYVTKEDFAHLIAKINALTMAQGASQGAVAQMAASTPPTASPPQLIVGGQQPEGYVYVGNHHPGGTIWGSIDTVTASMMETGAAENDEGT